MPTTTSSLLSKAISLGLDETERSMLSPPLLAQLAIGGHIALTPCDRRRMPKTTLALLAIGGFIELTRYERDSFNPQTLALLAVSGLTTLHPAELNRLSTDLQSVVKKKTAMLKAAQRLQGVKASAGVEIDHGFAFLPAIATVSR
jgi:hypothetical protein